MTDRQRIGDEIPLPRLREAKPRQLSRDAPTWRTLAAASVETMLHLPHADYTRLGNRVMCNSIHLNLRWKFGVERDLFYTDGKKCDLTDSTPG